MQPGNATLLNDKRKALWTHHTTQVNLGIITPTEGGQPGHTTTKYTPTYRARKHIHTNARVGGQAGGRGCQKGGKS